MSAGDELRSPEEIVVDRLVHVCIDHYYRDDAHSVVRRAPSRRLVPKLRSSAGRM